MTSNEPNDQPPPPSPWQPATPPPEAPKPGITRQGRAIAWLVLALVILILVMGTSPFWAQSIVPLLPWGQRQPTAERSAGAEAIRDLQARLDADEATLKQQANRLSRLDAAELAVKDQAARLARLEARPEAPAPAAPATTSAPPTQSSESASAIKALQDQIAKLATGSTTTADRLAKLEGQIERAGEVGRADRALLLALANLRVAAEGSGPFTAELAAAQSLAGDKANVKDALASLENDAKSGLPSLTTLTERFDHRVAAAVLRARGETKNEDWWQQIKARLERLVVIRRIAPGANEPGDATAAAVARADAALKAGDLAAAVSALDTLSGARAAAAAPWLAQAKKRVAAEATLGKLWQEESARIAAAGHGDKP